MKKQNPYYYSLPVTPKDFLGRWRLVNDIVTDLNNPRSDSWVIIGGRRFGKSSILRAIEYQLELKLEKQKKKWDKFVIPIKVDCKSSEMDSEQNIYALIIRSLYHHLPKQFFSQSITNKLAINQYKQVDKIPFYTFEGACSDLISYFSDHFGILRIAFLLDEIESTIDYPWHETLFNQLRSLIYDGPISNSIKLILVGSSRIIQVRQRGSPLLNALNIEYLENLSDDALHELANRGGYSDETIFNAIKFKSGGHPYIAQYLLHYLWKINFAEATIEDVNRIATQMRQERASDFQGWWESVGEAGREAYAELHKTDGWVNGRELRQKMIEISQTLDEGFTSLCFHGMVIRDSSREKYRIANELFREWFVLNKIDLLSQGKKNADKSQAIAQIIVEGDIVANKLQRNDFQLDSIEKILGDIQNTILSGFKDINKIYGHIFNELNENTRKGLSITIEAIKENKYNEIELEQMLLKVVDALDTVKNSARTSSEEMSQVLEKSKSIVESDLRLAQKLEFSLPIIPLILNYSAKWSTESKVDINLLLGELKAWWKSLVKNSNSRLKKERLK